MNKTTKYGTLKIDPVTERTKQKQESGIKSRKHTVEGETQEHKGNQNRSTDKERGRQGLNYTGVINNITQVRSKKCGKNRQREDMKSKT